MKSSALPQMKLNQPPQRFHPNKVRISSLKTILPTRKGGFNWKSPWDFSQGLFHGASDGTNLCFANLPRSTTTPHCSWYPSSRQPSKKQSTGLFFLTPSALLGFKSRHFTKKNRDRPKGLSRFLVRVTGLEPVRRGHTPLKRACLPVPAHSQISNALKRSIIISFYFEFVNQKFEISDKLFKLF